MSSTIRNSIFLDLCMELAFDPILLEHLVQSGFPTHREILEEYIKGKFGKENRSSNLLGDFLSWLGKNQEMAGTLVLQAKAQRDRLVKKKKVTHRYLTNCLYLRHRNSMERDNWFASIPVYKLARKQYPPYLTRIYEFAEILDLWRYHFEEKKQPDARITHKAFYAVDPQELQLDLLPDQSAVIFDEGIHGFPMLVWRGFCRDQEVLEWVDGVVQEGIGKKRSCRLEDPGKLCIAGYSMGSRKAPKFDWAKNLRSTRLSEEYIEELNYKISSAFALFWNMACGHLPDNILKTFTDYFDQLGVYRMDANMKKQTLTGSYTIEHQDMPITFNGVEMAPPTGMLGINYSRHIHREYSPHKYAMAWTTGRHGGLEDGGHFYLASHAVRVQSAPNTLVVWIPRLEHGTSLQNFHPEDVDLVFSQTGLAIVTPPKMDNIWKKYLEEGCKSAPNVQDSDSD